MAPFDNHSDVPQNQAQNQAENLDRLSGWLIGRGKENAPQGASWDGKGVNFSIWSRNAKQVYLCLFDENGETETVRIPLKRDRNNLWSAYLPQARPGLRYGYRVDGDYNPDSGNRFNVHKLLIDPCARLLDGEIVWHPSHYAFKLGQGQYVFNAEDSAPHMPKCVVVDESTLTQISQKTAKPNIPWQDTIIAESHVIGDTMKFPGIPDAQRGKLLGMAHPAKLADRERKGITADEWLPIWQHADEQHLVERGLRNYWQYNPVAFFAPSTRYLSDDGLTDVPTAIGKMHAAGKEVILDVVLNHTAEAGALGPHYSLKGIDNAAYYRLNPSNKAEYIDRTGCGNTLNFDDAQTVALAMDALRYWVTVMGADGYRFDLGLTLAYSDAGWQNSLFMKALHSDSVLKNAKLIMEPWDIAGYKLGHFQPDASEWNDTWRDGMRRFLKGDAQTRSQFAAGLSGSQNIFGNTERGSHASINFITAHDGFRLADLWSYNAKHNEANGENNRDGSNSNHSWNCGAEGATSDPEILALRRTMQANSLIALALSKGVPMLLSGDEVGHSQQGNNNPYCQDNEINYIDWAKGDTALEALWIRLAAFRKAHPAITGKNFFNGQPAHKNGVKDVTWFDSSGHEMTDKEWGHPYHRTLMVHIAGIPSEKANGDKIAQENILYLANPSNQEVVFQLPPAKYGNHWQARFDTSMIDKDDPNYCCVVNSQIKVPAHATIILTGQPDDHKFHLDLRLPGWLGGITPR